MQVLIILKKEPIPVLDNEDHSVALPNHTVNAKYEIVQVDSSGRCWVLNTCMITLRLKHVSWCL